MANAKGKITLVSLDGIKARYSKDKESWHDTFQEGDVWMQIDDGKGWGDPIPIVGYDGADGVQPNIFGYGTKVYCFSNSHQVFRTKDGLALGIYEYEMDNWREVLIFENVFVEDGFYSVSFEVKTNAASRPKILGLLSTADDIDGILQTEVTSDWSKIEAKLHHKYDEENDEALKSGFAAIIFDDSDGASSEEGYSEMITIRNLKIERSDNINGLSTPFVGLADDDIPQMGNLLRDTLSFSDETIWSAYNGNITEGLNGCKSFSLQNSNVLKEMLKQDITSVLKPNTFYTLSFYAKCSGTCTLSVKPYVSGQILDSGITWRGIRCVNGEAVIGDVDNNYRILESEEWRKHVVTFKTRQTLSGTKYAIWTVSAQASLSIAMPKLEECEKATPWQQNEADRKGDKGDDATTYQIDIIKAVFTRGTVYNTASIQARAYKITGNARQEITTDNSPCLKMDDGDDSLGFVYSKENGCYEIEEEIGADTKSLSVFVSPNAIANLPQALYSISVPVVFDGRVGAIARPCGQWSASATYVWNSDFRDIVIYNKEYYTVKREGMSLTGVVPTDTRWEKASPFRFVATDLLLSEMTYTDNLTVRNVQGVDGNGKIRMGIDQNGAMYSYDSQGRLVSSYNENGTGLMKYYYAALEQDGNRILMKEDVFTYNDDGSIKGMQTRYYGTNGIMKWYINEEGITSEVQAYWQFVTGGKWVGSSVPTDIAIYHNETGSGFTQYNMAIWEKGRITESSVPSTRTDAAAYVGKILPTGEYIVEGAVERYRKEGAFESYGARRIDTKYVYTNSDGKYSLTIMRSYTILS